MERVVISKQEVGKGVVVQDVLTPSELADYVASYTSTVDKPINYNDLFELTEFLINVGYEVEFKEEGDEDIYG